MSKKVFLFPDTNLFIQCNPLQSVDWSLLGCFDEIDIIVTRPVQAEIDSHKGKGASRLAKRARTTSSLFREIILNESNHIVLSKTKPTVRIHLRPDLKIDSSLADQLNYEERDDQLVGIATLFKKDNPTSETLLITYDTGPMASAKMVGLPFFEIPDAWLLQPETDETDKRIQALQAELKLYQNSEPSFECHLEHQKPIPPELEADLFIHEPLTKNEVNILIKKITENLPIETDFGPREPAERQPQGLFSHLLTPETYIPASDEQISEYQNNHYSKWLTKCESKLNNIHTEFRSKIIWPRIKTLIQNTGTRPAEDALVTFTAMGPLLIMPTPPASDEKQSDDEEIRLPNPPIAPKGRWTRKKLTDFSNMAMPRMDAMDIEPFLRSSTIANRRDPNGFYWKPARPEHPVSSFSLECEQWRHQIPPEDFDITLHVEATPNTFAGLLDIEIHAANMTKKFNKKIKVKINAHKISSFEEASELVKKLINSSARIQSIKNN